MAMQLMTYRTPVLARVAVMSEYIGRLWAETARPQTHLDALVGSPWDLLLEDAKADLKRAWQRLEVMADVDA
jgi:hypothetical protein